MRGYRQTDRHTNTPIAILCTSTESDVKITISSPGRLSARIYVHSRSRCPRSHPPPFTCRTDIFVLFWSLTFFAITALETLAAAPESTRARDSISNSLDFWLTGLPANFLGTCGLWTLKYGANRSVPGNVRVGWDHLWSNLWYLGYFEHLKSNLRQFLQTFDQRMGL